MNLFFYGYTDQILRHGAERQLSYCCRVRAPSELTQELALFEHFDNCAVDWACRKVTPIPGETYLRHCLLVRINNVYGLCAQQLDRTLLLSNSGQGQRLIGNCKHSASVRASLNAFVDGSLGVTL